MKYKAIILDLDGTIIPNSMNGMPSMKVKKAIRKAQSQVHVCIATSRSLFKMLHIVKYLNIQSPCIINGSTQIYDPQSNTFIWERYLKKSQVRDIQKVFHTHSVPLLISDGITAAYVKNLDSFNFILSVYCNGIEKKLASKIILELQKIPGIYIRRFMSWREGKVGIEITDAYVSKKHGIEYLCSLLHIHPEEIIGVGDGYNDYPLLSACGLKVAMGNAVDEVKAIADYIAPSVDEDGVAHVIEKFILNDTIHS